MNKLLDLLLFPKSFYRRLTSNKTWLYVGMAFVGIVDLIYAYIDNYAELFTGKTQSILLFNSLLAVILIAVIGFIDVLFFSLPVFDLFKLFKKKEIQNVSSSLAVIVMKVYIVAHILIVPVNSLLYFLERDAAIAASPAFITIYGLYTELLLPIWFSAAIARGVNIIYGFKPVFVRFAFAAVFLWNMLYNTAFGYLVSGLVMALFR